MNWLNASSVGGRHDRPLHESEDPVRPVDELRPRQREPTRLGRQPPRVGRRRRPGSPGTGPRPATTKLPDSTSASTSLSTGSDSPVSNDSSISSPSAARTMPSVDDLVAGAQLEQVVEHHGVHRDLAHGAVAHDACVAARRARPSGRACASPATPARSRSARWSRARCRTARPGTHRTRGSARTSFRGSR